MHVARWRGRFPEERARRAGARPCESACGSPPCLRTGPAIHRRTPLALSCSAAPPPTSNLPQLLAWLRASGCCPDEAECRVVAQALFETGVLVPSALTLPPTAPEGAPAVAGGGTAIAGSSAGGEGEGSESGPRFLAGAS
jgi:hypothetical protein